VLKYGDQETKNMILNSQKEKLKCASQKDLALRASQNTNELFEKNRFELESNKKPILSPVKKPLKGL
jgi:hypothetical protein